MKTACWVPVSWENRCWKGIDTRNPVRICRPVWVTRNSCKSSFRFRALGDPGLAASIPARADLLGRLGLDQLLHHHPDRLPDQIDTLAGAERLQQLRHGRLRQRHRWDSFSEYLAVHTEDPADGPYRSEAAPVTRKPHHSGRSLSLSHVVR